MSLFWIASAWPNGALAITFCAIIVVLLPLQGDLAYSQSMAFLKGCVLGSGIAAALVFAILPRATTFPTLCLALGLPLVPLGFMLARAKNPLFFFACSVNLLPMLSINNTISFDASQFWNSASAHRCRHRCRGGRDAHCASVAAGHSDPEAACAHAR